MVWAATIFAWTMDQKLIFVLPGKVLWHTTLNTSTLKYFEAHVVKQVVECFLEKWGSPDSMSSPRDSNILTVPSRYHRCRRRAVIRSSTFLRAPKDGSRQTRRCHSKCGKPRLPWPELRSGNSRPYWSITGSRGIDSTRRAEGRIPARGHKFSPRCEVDTSIFDMVKISPDGL